MLCCSSNTLIFLIFFSSILLSLAANSKECGIIDPFQFENNQRVTQIDEFPWMARMAYNMTKTLKIAFHCQAVLISQQHLITAAQCMRERADMELYAVLLGDWNISDNIFEEDCDNVDKARKICSTPLLIEIDEIIVHPYFSIRKKENDIGLLRLTQAVTFTDYMRPICLPSNDIKSKEFGSEELTFTGWLLNENGPKLKRSVFIFNRHDCRRKYKGQEVEISESHLCGNACEDGRSYLAGTALMDVKDPELESPNQVYLVQVHLVGLLSFGLSMCNRRTPDVFTRVDKYLDWINENIN